MVNTKSTQSIFLVTGSIRGGKTTFLTNLIVRLKQSKLKVGGILCPGKFSSGKRSAFSLKNIQNGAELPMASNLETAGWFKYRRFWFNPEAFKQGEIWIREGLKKNTQIMVIDELGPMELEGSGWSVLLNDLAKTAVPVQLWSVRESIIEEVMKRWSIPSSNLIHIEKLAVDQAAALISERLKNVSAQ
jgi:nucleoside-triphosphatase THEP1